MRHACHCSFFHVQNAASDLAAWSIAAYKDVKFIVTALMNSVLCIELVFFHDLISMTHSACSAFLNAQNVSQVSLLLSSFPMLLFCLVFKQLFPVCITPLHVFLVLMLFSTPLRLIVDNSLSIFPVVSCPAVQRCLGAGPANIQ